MCSSGDAHRRLYPMEAHPRQYSISNDAAASTTDTKGVPSPTVAGGGRRAADEGLECTAPLTGVERRRRAASRRSAAGHSGATTAMGSRRPNPPTTPKACVQPFASCSWGWGWAAAHDAS